MAVEARYGGVAGAPAAACFSRGSLAAEDAEAQVRAVMQDQYGAFLSAVAATANNGGGGGYNCAAVASGAQSELTCNNGDGGAALASWKRGREAEQYVSSSSALLPIPGMAKAVDARAVPGRLVGSVMASTSGRPSAAPVASFDDVVVSELYKYGSEIDAIVRMECERMRAGLEQVRKRQCQSLMRAASSAATRRLLEKEAELQSARQRAAELEERLRQAAAESQAWCGVARNNEAVAAGLRATLSHLLRAGPAPVEGFGESDFTPATALDAADDAQSSCFVGEDTSKDTTSSPAGKWACKSCGEGEASVLLLPCRHLCLCKACEPRLDSCPVCLAVKNASIHIAMD